MAAVCEFTKPPLVGEPVKGTSPQFKGTFPPFKGTFPPLKGSLPANLNLASKQAVQNALQQHFAGLLGKVSQAVPNFSKPSGPLSHFTRPKRHIRPTGAFSHRPLSNRPFSHKPSGHFSRPSNKN